MCRAFIVWDFGGFSLSGLRLKGLQLNGLSGSGFHPSDGDAVLRSLQFLAAC